MGLNRPAYELVAEALRRVQTIGVLEARELQKSPENLFVDIREASELEREGRIPGSVHVPRGTLEFLVDPESAYHRREFREGRPLVLYCQEGARSALAAATLMDMGIANVSHLDGGFSAWKKSGADVLNTAS